MTESTVNVTQAAKLIPCSRSYVYKLIEAGEILAYRTGERRGVRVYRESIADFIARRKEICA